MMTVAQIVVRMRQKALIPPRMYSSLPCGLALPLTMALTFSVRDPAKHVMLLSSALTSSCRAPMSSCTVLWLAMTGGFQGLTCVCEESALWYNACMQPGAPVQQIMLLPYNVADTAHVQEGKLMSIETNKVTRM